MKRYLSRKNGFTIVELLVVIVIIGILAAITIVSYTGITQKATAASLQADLANASKKIKIWQLTESLDGNFPGSVSSCPTPTSGNMCLKKSDGALFDAYAATTGANPTFSLTANNGPTSYRITQDTAPTIAVTTGSLATTDPANWIAVGTQVWGKYNLNVGTMVPGSMFGTPIDQTNDYILEKYCYNDTESNCTTSGGLYQWNEAMQYVTNEGARGICPVGSHIPSDNDWKILEMQLGMTQVEADTFGWRGTDQGIQLGVGGLSGLNVLLVGYRLVDGSFNSQLSAMHLWASSQSGALDAWVRYLFPATYTNVSRYTVDKGNGLSVRCVGD